MDKELKHVEKEEKVLATKEKNAEAKQRDLEKREDDIDRREHDIEKDFKNNGRHHESWGEMPGEKHHIQMKPLNIEPWIHEKKAEHHPTPDLFNGIQGFQGLMSFHDLLKKNMQSIVKPGAVKKTEHKKHEDKKHEDKKHEEKKHEEKKQ